METKLFGDKKLTISPLSKKDSKFAKEFLVFVNSLIEEEAMILMDKKMTIKEEREFLKKNIKAEKDKKKIFLIAKDGNKVVGNISIERGMYRRSHMGKFAIGIANGYRGIGLGKYLMSGIIKRAIKEFKPKLEIIQLEVHANNKVAISLYKRMGFKRFAKLPKQIQHKGRIDDELIMIKFL